MNKNEIIDSINELYEKYEVDKTIFEKLDKDELIRSMKGILAELDKKKKREYTKEDIITIRKIYNMCC